MSRPENFKELADEEFLEQWAAVRTHGRTRFALKRGVLVWGSLMALGMSLGLWLSGRSHPVVFVFLIVCLSASGFFLGCLIWKRNEEKFAELQASHQ